jgi:alkylated DNA repair protein (DNA oxidative demethylase)
MPEAPEGLVYEPEFLSASEERDLLAAIEGLDFREIRMRGQTARRTARHFGYDYDYEHYGRLVPGDPLPPLLASLRDRCARLAGLEPEKLAQALVQRYPPGATIGWHRDAPMFGTVVGVSLGSACRMRFQRGRSGKRETFDLELEPRSAYVLAGSARNAWQHSIPPTKSLRYSVTYRTLRSPERWTAARGS